MTISTSRSLLGRLRSDHPDERDRTRFVELYRLLLLNFAQSQLNLQRDDAEDLVQDVFIRLLFDSESNRKPRNGDEELRITPRALQHFDLDDENRRFRPWMLKVFQNAYLNWMKRRGREVQMDAVDRLFETSIEFEESNYQMELLTRAIEIVRQSNAVNVEVFLQVKKEGRPCQEVADERGMTKGAIYQIVHRVRCDILEIIHGLNS